MAAAAPNLNLWNQTADIPHFMNYELHDALFLLLNILGHDPIHDYYGTSDLSRWEQNKELVSGILTYLDNPVNIPAEVALIIAAAHGHIGGMSRDLHGKNNKLLVDKDVTGGAKGKQNQNRGRQNPDEWIKRGLAQSRAKAAAAAAAAAAPGKKNLNTPVYVNVKIHPKTNNPIISSIYFASNQPNQGKFALKQSLVQRREVRTIRDDKAEKERIRQMHLHFQRKEQEAIAFEDIFEPVVPVNANVMEADEAVEDENVKIKRIIKESYIREQSLSTYSYITINPAWSWDELQAQIGPICMRNPYILSQIDLIVEASNCELDAVGVGNPTPQQVLDVLALMPIIAHFTQDQRNDLAARVGEYYTSNVTYLSPLVHPATIKINFEARQRRLKFLKDFCYPIIANLTNIAINANNNAVITDVRTALQTDSSAFVTMSYMNKCIENINELVEEIQNTILFAVFINYLNVPIKVPPYPSWTWLDMYALIKHKGDSSGVPPEFYNNFVDNFFGWMCLTDPTIVLTTAVSFQNLTDALNAAFDDGVVESTFFETFNYNNPAVVPADIDMANLTPANADAAISFARAISNASIQQVLAQQQGNPGGGSIQMGGDRPPCATCNAVEAQIMVTALNEGLTFQQITTKVNRMQHIYDTMSNEQATTAQIQAWTGAGGEYEQSKAFILKFFTSLWSTTLIPAGDPKFAKKCQILKKEFVTYMPILPSRAGGRTIMDISSKLTKIVRGTYYDCVNTIRQAQIANAALQAALEREAERALAGAMSANDLVARGDFARMLARSALYFCGIAQANGVLTPLGTAIAGFPNGNPGRLLMREMNILRFIAMTRPVPAPGAAPNWPNANDGTQVTNKDVDTELLTSATEIYPDGCVARTPGNYFCARGFAGTDGTKYIVNNAASAMTGATPERLTFCNPASIMDGMTYCPPSSVGQFEGLEIGDMHFQIQNLAFAGAAGVAAAGAFYYNGRTELNADWAANNAAGATANIHITLRSPIIGQVNLSTGVNPIRNKILEAKKVLAATLNTFITKFQIQAIRDGITALINTAGPAAAGGFNTCFSATFTYFTNPPEGAPANFTALGFQNVIYKDILFKGWGDFSQEISCVCKFGGYIRQDYQASDDVLSYLNATAQGWQTRLCVGGDRPSGIRSFVALITGRPEDINMLAMTGYYVDGTPNGDFIGKRPELTNFCTRTFINAAGPAVFVGGKLKRKNRKTRKHKKIVKTKKNMKMKKGRKTRIRGIHIKRMKQNVPRKRITKKVK